MTVFLNGFQEWVATFTYQGYRFVLCEHNIVCVYVCVDF